MLHSDPLDLTLGAFLAASPKVAASLADDPPPTMWARKRYNRWVQDQIHAAQRDMRGVSKADFLAAARRAIEDPT